MTSLRGFAVVLAGLLLLSCGGEGPISGDVTPNVPPDTVVTATPPVLSTAGFEVSFYWTGSDPDGRVDAFEWRISDNGPDGIVDVEDTLAAYLPWRWTAKTDSTFLVSADLDSFPPDAADPRIGPRAQRFWQTHTFYIRAIDEDGRRDPSPAHVSFTATTLAPTVRINLPALTVPPDCIQGPRVLTFGWVGDDADYVTGDPESVRYLLKPYQTEAGACITQTLYEQINPIRNDDPLWSPWIRYDAELDSGKLVTFDRQETGKSFLFAVQARDVAGAVTPTFEWGRNVRHVQTSASKYPLLRATDPFLGTFSAVSTTTVSARDIVEGQPLRFNWEGNASPYAGIIEAYRYGWDVQDPEDPNDPGWAVAWGNGPSWRRAPEQSFQQGSHSFIVQCRDNSGTVSRVTLILRVIQVPDPSEQRQLLLVDDWKDDPGDNGERLDLLWDAVWQQHLSGVEGFQPNDVIESSTAAARITFSALADYRSVIWFVSPNAGSYLHTQFAPVNRTERQFNWLEVYQARVGNLLLVGPGALASTVEDNNWIYPLVFNVAATQRLGFGSCTGVGDVTINCGLLRWPHSGWCVELVDQLRPPVGGIFGEQDGGDRVRTAECDLLHTAVVDTLAFTKVFPAAVSDFDVVDLSPAPERIDYQNNQNWAFLQEEIYNVNTTRRSVSIAMRPCQVPMFRWHSRRDAGLGPADPVANCRPRGRTTSSWEGMPAALASQAYSDTKPTRGASDFVWGFNPMGFRGEQVQRAISWILQDNWQLRVQ